MKQFTHLFYFQRVIYNSNMCLKHCSYRCYVVCLLYNRKYITFVEFWEVMGGVGLNKEMHYCLLFKTAAVYIGKFEAGHACKD